LQCWRRRASSSAANKSRSWEELSTCSNYSVTLSDGTVVRRSEGPPEGPKNDLTAADWEEVGRLTAANEGETLGTYDEDVNGKPFKFTRVKYVLSDGTEVIQSTGTPDAGR
jgi:hypothetical protein